MPGPQDITPFLSGSPGSGGGGGGGRVGGGGRAVLFSHSTWAEVRASRVPWEMSPERVVTSQGRDGHLVSLHLQSACLVAGTRAPERAQPAPAGVP